MKPIQSWLAITLLFFILLTQILILVRLPNSPQAIATIGTRSNAKSDSERKELLQNILLVRVVSGSLDVNVENYPLAVEIYR